MTTRKDFDMTDANVKLNYHQSASKCHDKLVDLCDKWEMDNSDGSTMRLDVDDEFMSTIYSTVRILSKIRGDNQMNTNKILEIPYPVGTILSAKVDGKWQDDKIDHYVVTENGLGVVLILNYDKHPKLSRSIPINLIMKKWVPANVDINEVLSDLNSALKNGIEALENYDKNKKNEILYKKLNSSQYNEVVSSVCSALKNNRNNGIIEFDEESKTDRCNLKGLKWELVLEPISDSDE